MAKTTAMPSRALLMLLALAASIAHANGYFLRLHTEPNYGGATQVTNFGVKSRCYRIDTCPPTRNQISSATWELYADTSVCFCRFIDCGGPCKCWAMDFSVPSPSNFALDFYAGGNFGALNKNVNAFYFTDNNRGQKFDRVSFCPPLTRTFWDVCGQGQVPCWSVSCNCRNAGSRTSPELLPIPLARTNIVGPLALPPASTPTPNTANIAAPPPPKIANATVP